MGWFVEGKPSCFPSTPLLPPNKHGAGYKEGGVRSDDRSDDQREDEPANAFRGEEKEHEEHDECADTGVHRPCQGFEEASVHDGFQGLTLAVRYEITADTVEDDDRVIHRISHDRKERGDIEGVHFEGRIPSDDDEDADGDDDVVEERDNRCDAEAPRGHATRNFPKGRSEVDDDC